jgi:2'-5' RNA ligase
MDSLEVVARPRFDKTDVAWLMEMRAKRTSNYGPPYFTLVFPGATMEPGEFANLVRQRAREVHRIRFRLRSALVVPEAAVKRFHVFLIPDEGFGAILKLHDRLHAGPLEVCLRPETPYLPHITVATTADYAAARKLAASLNANDLQIDGAIDALQVERRAGDVARLVAEIPLEKGGWFG